ncbi:hypothetical protein BFW01_g8175 [Lasiodiplodia theobromae]|uniref:Uncharacterized protein n=1 Tax=Lasiodiplodia theobromae TaxID=45133 RepID=A0A5N5D3C0_9PEZI|nr:hypothetical protein DBV05_g9456 [Lasiodiplodia theobromae]KAF9637279.1 hypothetical protein BFW01_g8175 [Lasiodiplodia theobromae]
MAAPPNATQTITHIVLFKYKATITWADFESHFETFRALQQQCLHPLTGRPYMLSMRMGKNRSWEPFNKGMTHAFVLEFASQDDLDYYLTKDPVHLAFSRAAHPLIEDSVVVDIRDGVLFGPGAKRPAGVTFPGEEGKRWKGSCHCGGCEWEVAIKGEGEELKHVLCHCDTCKKLGGGPYSCNYIVPKDDLKVTKGSPSVYTYKGASGKDVRCFFCPTCTSHIYHHQDAMPEKVIVRTLLLEGGNDLEAGGEIFPEGKLKWVQDLKESLEPVPSKKAANGVNGVNGV